jgi:hypothetical protein
MREQLVWLWINPFGDFAGRASLDEKNDNAA